MNKKYAIIWAAIGETWDDAVEVSEYNREYALDHYLEKADRESWFVDGYPQNQEFHVKDVETGEIFIYVVETEWEPRFVIH